MASPQWRRGQRSEGHASAKRVRFDLPRVHGQWPGTIRGAEPTAGSSFVVGNYITDKTTLTRLRLHQTHPANDSTPQAAQNLQPNTSFMLRGGSAETMRVLSCGAGGTSCDVSWDVMICMRVAHMLWHVRAWASDIASGSGSFSSSAWSLPPDRSSFRSPRRQQASGGTLIRAYRERAGAYRRRRGLRA